MLFLQFLFYNISRISCAQNQPRTCQFQIGSETLLPYCSHYSNNCLCFEQYPPSLTNFIRSLQEIEDLQSKYLEICKKADAKKNNSLESSEENKAINKLNEKEKFARDLCKNIKWENSVEYFEINDNYFTKEVEGLRNNKFLEIQLIFAARSFKKYIFKFENLYNCIEMNDIKKFMLDRAVTSEFDESEEISAVKEFFTFCLGLKKELEEKTIFIFQNEEKIEHLNKAVRMLLPILEDSFKEMTKLSSMFFDLSKESNKSISWTFDESNFENLSKFYELYWKGIKIYLVKEELQLLFRKGAKNSETLAEYEKYDDIKCYRTVSNYSIEKYKEQGRLRILFPIEDFLKNFLRKSYGEKYEEKIKEMFCSPEEKINERNNAEEELINEVIQFNTKVEEMHKDLTKTSFKYEINECFHEYKEFIRRGYCFLFERYKRLNSIKYSDTYFHFIKKDYNVGLIEFCDEPNADIKGSVESVSRCFKDETFKNTFYMLKTESENKYSTFCSQWKCENLTKYNYL